MLEAFVSSPNHINYSHPNTEEMTILCFNHSPSYSYYWLLRIGGLNCIFHLLYPFQPLKAYRYRLKDPDLLKTFLKLHVMLCQELK